MQRSRSLALMFLLGALLVGGALGFTADRVLTSDRCAKSGDNRRSFAWLTEELHLTPEQSAAVDSIVERRHREMRAVISTVRPQMVAVRDTARQQIRRVLNDAQRAQFDELLARKDSEKEKKTR
jgi:Spy/CpxP family protein refolding chaperone